jgi:hypothetical protein
MWMPPGSKRMQQTAEQLQLMQQNISGIITTSGSKFLTGALFQILQSHPIINLKV